MRHLLPILLFLCLAASGGHCHEPVPAPAGLPGERRSAPLDLNAASAEQLEATAGEIVRPWLLDRCLPRRARAVHAGRATRTRSRGLARRLW